jgi:hypothetical protein
MVLSCYNTSTVSFTNREGVELFQIGKDRTGADTYDTVYIKDNNSVAVSSGGGDNRGITIIDIMEIVVMTSLLSISIIVIPLLSPPPDDTATLLLSLI